jgi:arabinofuranosyltransferase
MLNRLDHGLLVIPALLATALQLLRRAAVTLITAASAPVAGWLLFSLIYYGFPFPNTFYAKQATGIPRVEYLERGVGYLIDTAIMDAVTLLGIVFAVGSALWRRRPFTLLAAAAGVVLYALYVIWIGGDFVGGRMFSAPLAASLAILASAKPSGHKQLVALPVILLALGLVALNRPYLTSSEPLRGTFTGSIEQALLGRPAVGGLYSIT